MRSLSTIPVPSNFYGRSKLEAEKGLNLLADSDFKVVILRPPMIYGKGAKGNYPKLAKLACKLPMFPDVDNQRSMLYIENLCEFIRLMIDNDEQGLFFPQNTEYVKTSEMVRLIAQAHGKKIKLMKMFNSILKLIGQFHGLILINKVFGNLIYEKSISEYKENYRVIDLYNSIIKTELDEESHEKSTNDGISCFND